jgi:hypothetical protein
MASCIMMTRVIWRLRKRSKEPAVGVGGWVGGREGGVGGWVGGREGWGGWVGGWVGGGGGGRGVVHWHSTMGA